MKNRFYRYEGQLQTLRSQMLVSAIGSLILGAYGVYLFWSEDNQHNLISWFIALAVSCFANNILATQSKRAEGKAAYRFLNLFTILGILAGLIWAIPAYWIVSGQAQVLQPEIGSFFIVIATMGMATAAMGSTSAYLPFYYCSVSPFALSFLVACFQADFAPFKGGEFTAILSVYFVTIYWFTFNINKGLLNAIDLKHFNEQLAQDYLDEKNKAQEANRQKSYFLAAASHDLRQPLQSLVLHCELLTDEVADSRGQSILKNVHSSISSLTRLFNVLLDMSKLESGTLELVRSHFKITRLFDRLSANYQEQALKQGIELKFVTQALWVNTDLILLQRCISNLLDNALVHANASRILVAARQSQGQILLYVMDNGIGVRQSDQDRIFNDFEQLNNPERERKKGLGLGLSIVKLVFKLLGHNFEFSSQYNLGVKFVISLPQGQEVVPKQSIFEPNFPLLDGCRVWSIDNDEAVRKALEMTLNSWGAKMTSVANQYELDRLLVDDNVTRPDIVLCDYRFAKNLNGTQIICQIRDKFDVVIPALILSGDTSAEKIEAIKSSGVPLLHKPVTGAKLRIAMQHILLL